MKAIESRSAPASVLQFAAGFAIPAGASLGRWWSAGLRDIVTALRFALEWSGFGVVVVGIAAAVLSAGGT